MCLGERGVVPGEVRFEDRDRLWAELDAAIFTGLRGIPLGAVDASPCNGEHAIHALVVAHDERDLFRRTGGGKGAGTHGGSACRIPGGEQHLGVPNTQWIEVRPILLAHRPAWPPVACFRLVLETEGERTAQRADGMVVRAGNVAGSRNHAESIVELALPGSMHLRLHSIRGDHFR